MYSAVSARIGEIATLRALGFGRTSIVTSVFVESTLLSLVGGSIGALVAWLLFNGYTASTRSNNGAQLAFGLDVSWTLIAFGMLWALIIGLVGAFFPAIRAMRMPVAVALRDT
jgi:putative ABC transport system permease protein